MNVLYTVFCNSIASPHTNAVELHGTPYKSEQGKLSQMPVKDGPANVLWHNELLSVSMAADSSIRAQTPQYLVLCETP